MAVEPPPIAKSAYRQVGPNEVVVVGVSMTFKQSLELAVQWIIAISVGLVLTCPLWGAILAAFVAFAREGR